MALAMKQGTMLATFSNLTTIKMKNPAETHSKVIEIDKMAKITAGVTGSAVGDGHWKSVLVGMLDPITRQHTSSLMGSTHTAEDLKQAILEFTSNMVLENDPMNLDSVGKSGQDEGSEQWGDNWGNGDQWDWGNPEDWGVAEGANALYKGGPKGGCWKCGGAHYASNCPKGKGKGQDGKGKGGNNGGQGRL